MHRFVVAKSIDIDVCLFQPVQQNLDRKSQITQRKIAVARLRQHFLSGKIKELISDDEIVRTEFGKPYLKAHSEFHFNYSHSQDYFALASSHGVQDIGVDIEQLDRKVRFEALAKHAFHFDEYQQWKALDEDIEYWFKVWTTKEAVLKASGLGIRIGLNTLNTQATAHSSGGMCQHEAVGAFAYRHYVVGHAILTVAWRAEPSCRGFQFPNISLLQH